MASLSTAKELLGVAGNLHTAKDPASAETELCAGTAGNKKEAETSVQMGMGGGGTEVMLPSNEKNGAMHTEMEKVPSNDRSLLDSPVLPAYDPSRTRRVSKNEQEQVPIQDGDGMLLHDDDGNCICEQAGWHVLCDQRSMVLWDQDGQLCIEQDVDEDVLVLQTREVHKQVPESLFEQNQCLQLELNQAQLTHQKDVKRMQEEIAQRDADPNNQSRCFTLTCWHCSQIGHYANSCNNPPVFSQNGLPPGNTNNLNGSVENRCRFCQKENAHLSIDCPTKLTPHQ